MTARPVETNGREMRGLVWKALIGPLSWSLFFIVGYLVAEAACLGGFLRGQVAGTTVMVVVLVALGLAATGVALWGAFLGYRRWREAEGERVRTQTREGEHVQQTEDLAAFLALAGALLNVLFALTTVVTALSMIFLKPCSWT